MGMPTANGGGGSGFQGHFNPAFVGSLQGNTNRNSITPDGPRKRFKTERDA